MPKKHNPNQEGPGIVLIKTKAAARTSAWEWDFAADNLNKGEAQVDARYERLRMLVNAIVHNQEEERKHISSELQEEIGQSLTALNLNLYMLRAELREEPQKTQQIIRESVDLVYCLINQMRKMAQDLRPPALETFGLNLTLEAYCRDFTKHTQISICYSGANLPPLLDSTAISLYRLLQEGLTNIVQHAHASQVFVSLRNEDHIVRLVIRDNGSGFQLLPPFDPTPGEASSQRLGLLSLKERFVLSGGDLEIQTAPGCGTTLAGALPLIIV